MDDIDRKVGGQRWHIRAEWWRHRGTSPETSLGELRGTTVGPSGVKRSGDVRGPNPMVLGRGYGYLRTVGGILLLFFEATGGGLLRLPSVQVKGLGGFRGLERCSLSRRRGSSGFESPRRRRRLAMESMARCGVPRGGQACSLYRGQLCRYV
jgi:hypothetical protein